MRVMILVTHLHGTGHLTRALTLASAFKEAGHEVLVASGGVPPAHLQDTTSDLVQLPPVRSNGTDFSVLLDAKGDVASENYLATRQRQLINAFTSFAPDVIITELFPFGRRILRTEFTAFLEAAKARAQPPRIVASIRDILAPPSKPAKAAFADDMIARYYDAVLVHSDPDIAPLELSWPVPDRLRPALRYTGFVAPPPAAPPQESSGKDEILVSAGGGDVGDTLFDTAKQAAGMDSPHHWRLLVGGQNARTRCAVLNADAPANLIAEPARPDFRQMLHHACASVSLCGYNTALDVLQTGCPAVFIPYDAGGEVEQGIRARALAQQPGIAVLQSAQLSPAGLLAAIAGLRGPRRAPLGPVQTNGAARSVEIVQQIVGGPHAD